MIGAVRIICFMPIRHTIYKRQHNCKRAWNELWVCVSTITSGRNMDFGIIERSMAQFTCFAIGYLYPAFYTLFVYKRHGSVTLTGCNQLTLVFIANATSHSTLFYKAYIHYGAEAERWRIVPFL